MPEHHRALSKLIAHALRHEPEQYDLTPDKDGWVTIDALLSALGSSSQRWAEIRQSDIEELISSSDKQRYQLDTGRIRALYGHTTKKIDPQYTSLAPPEILFHGTTSKALTEIRKSGLKSMKRRYLHLSPDTETAKQVALRRTNKPQIIKIKAQEAARDGIVFYNTPANIWLTSPLEIQYLDFTECDPA